MAQVFRHPTTFAQDYVAALVQLGNQTVMTKPKKVKYTKGQKGPKPRYVKPKLVSVQAINGMSIRDYIALQQKEV